MKTPVRSSASTAEPSSRRVVLPFMFDLTVTEKSKRKAFIRPTPSFIEVDIPVLPSETVPVVANWISVDTRHFDENGISRASVPVRYGEGHFLARASPGGKIAISDALFDPSRRRERVRFQAEAIVSYMCPGYGIGHAVDIVGSLVKELQDGEFRLDHPLREGDRTADGKKIVQENREFRKEQALAKAGTFVVIDGEVWKKIEEPKLLFSRVSDGRYSVDVSFLGTKGAHASVEFFALTDYEGLRARLEVEDPALCGRMIEEVDVLDRGPFSFDRRRDILGDIVLRIVENYGPAIGTMTGDDVGDFIAMRDAAAGIYSGNGADVPTEEIADIVRGFLDRMPDGKDKSVIAKRVARLDEEWSKAPTGQTSRMTP